MSVGGQKKPDPQPSEKQVDESQLPVPQEIKGTFLKPKL